MDHGQPSHDRAATPGRAHQREETAAREVLVVDGSPAVPRLLRMHLERAGWQVQEAADGLGALRAAKTRPPAVIVTAGLMPGMDGFLLCRAVRADPQLAAVPVVIYSSISTTEKDAALARSAGATVLVSRGESPAGLPGLLDRILAGTIDPAPLPDAGDPGGAPAHLDHLVAVLLDQQLALDRALEAEREHARALADLDRLRQSLINALSHELRTPLTVVRGHASLLQGARAALPPERAQRQGTAIMESCNRLANLLDDIMLVARLDEDTIPLYTAPVELCIAARTAATSVQNRYGSSQCPIELACPQDLWVEANMRYLTHALTHLIDNAVKHSPAGVPVQIVGGRDGAGATMVRVRDHGPGLPAGDVNRLFEKFHKGTDDTMRAARFGVGIGLYLVRTLTERMGGTVGALARPEGGAEFWLRLRAAPSPLA
ncbi:MAG: hypothetical protein NVSMB65_06720 [Chloroflexota bacterium]